MDLSAMDGPILKFLCTPRWQSMSRRHWLQLINLHLACWMNRVRAYERGCT
jgi:hypothetical protein